MRVEKIDIILDEGFNIFKIGVDKLIKKQNLE